MRLHEQVKVLKAQMETYKTGIDQIRRYLSSEKFWQDNSVNVKDIFLRLDEIQADINLIN